MGFWAPAHDLGSSTARIGTGSAILFGPFRSRGLEADGMKIMPNAVLHINSPSWEPELLPGDVSHRNRVGPLNQLGGGDAASPAER